ncbi:MAG: two-component sensor histidine kinase, partial [Microcystis panniformis]
MKLPRLVGIFGQFLPSKPVSTSSLQFRLTLELLTISIIGLGSVAIWAGWQMEQNLVAAHKQTLEYIAKRFPEQLEMYAQMGSLTTGLEKTIERVSTAGLVIWVKNS